jgi:Mrp family chromosome partitioning ATPase
VKILAEIPAAASPDARAGTLRRRDMEAFEGLLAGLAGRRSVLIAGAGPGRRRAAIGLAATAVAAGTSTALLECDLADPGLADALGLANAPGLCEYLGGAVTAEEILHPVILAGPGAGRAVEPLVCAVAGRRSGAAAELLAGDRLAQALAGLQAAYELVVVAGPLLEEWSVLSLLWDHVDATVACLGRTEAKRKLTFPVAGVVIED